MFKLWFNFIDTRYRKCFDSINNIVILSDQTSGNDALLKINIGGIKLGFKLKYDNTWQIFGIMNLSSE